MDTILKLSEYDLLVPEKGIVRFGSEAFFIEMIGVMINECMPEDMASVHSAYEQQDWMTLKDAIHKIKGGATYCGADRLEYLCEKLEILMEENEMLPAALYKIFCATVDETLEAIQHLMVPSDPGLTMHRHNTPIHNDLPGQGKP